MHRCVPDQVALLEAFLDAFLLTLLERWLCKLISHTTLVVCEFMCFPGLL